ncbi:MAG: DUF3795 domain-containing protein [Pseudomonadota bacterium]
MIAYCGLDCEKCDIFRATRSDEAERERVATDWSRRFGFKLAAPDIACDGCSSDGARQFSFCAACKVRTCCREKELAHCAKCGDAPCGKLTEVFSLSGNIKKAFEALAGK